MVFPGAFQGSEQNVPGNNLIIEENSLGQPISRRISALKKLFLKGVIVSQIGSLSSSLGYGNMLGSVSGLSGMGVKKSVSTLASESLSQIDTDGSGSISQTEFENALAGVTSANGTSSTASASNALADKLFKKIDANGDGKISSDEWNTFQQKIEAHQGHGHHHHAQASSPADSSQSATQTLQSLVAQLYKSADTSGDGQLSQGELTSWLSSTMASL
jgi:Ca2+-binding EF-hand superfamily protein